MTLEVLARRVNLSILLPVVVMGLCCTSVVGQTLPNCSEAPVTYSALDPGLGKRIVLEVTADANVPAQDSAKQYSPRRTKWQITVAPDYSKGGPWTTAVYIGSGTGQALKLSLIDHASYDVHVQWLNEKLLFGTVAWGRIVATDFILDVEKRQFIYEEMANSFGVTNPCPKGGVNR